MATARDNRFHERLTELGGGLKVEKTKRPAMPNVAGLKLDTSVDLSQIENFTAASVEIRGAAEKIKPQQGGELRVDADFSKLDESLDKLKQQKLDARIQGLVEKARNLMDRGDYRAALKPLNKALGISPTSTQVLLLQGYCYFNLEDYEGALTVLDEARQHTQDSDTALLILILQAACQRAINDKMGERIAVLLEKGRFDEALKLIEDQLRVNPENTLLLYYKCGILLTMGREAEAKRIAQHALTHVDGESAQMFQELLGNITLRENQKYLDAARAALRRGDPKGALEELQICQAALAGTERYDAIRAYAHERLPSRGFFSSLFSRNREKPQKLDEGMRQQLLFWLLDDELNAGADALKQERYKQAIKEFEKAHEIDSDCSLVCYLHGLAIFNDFRATMERQDAAPPDLDQALRSLKLADAVLERAVADPVMGEQGSVLQKVLRGDIQQLQEIKREIERRAKEEKPINDLIQDFNTLMEKLERDRIGNISQLENTARSFRDIKQRAQKLHNKRSKDQAAEILDKLISIVDSYLKQFAEGRGEILVADCLDNFNNMMEGLNKRPIRTSQDLDRTRTTVSSLQLMLQLARKEKLSSDASRILGQLEDALRTISRQLY